MTPLTFSRSSSVSPLYLVVFLWHWQRQLALLVSGISLSLRKPISTLKGPKVLRSGFRYFIIRSRLRFFLQNEPRETYTCKCLWIKECFIIIARRLCSASVGRPTANRWRWAIHSFILNIHIAPLQESYSEAFVSEGLLQSPYTQSVTVTEEDHICTFSLLWLSLLFFYLRYVDISN